MRQVSPYYFFASVATDTFRPLARKTCKITDPYTAPKNKSRRDNGCVASLVGRQQTEIGNSAKIAPETV